MATMTALPSYIYRKIENDLPSPSSLRRSPWTQQATRIARAVLPFFTLYKPLSYPMALAMGSARLITAASTYKLRDTAIAAAALMGTCFGHPLGMLIASIDDVRRDVSRLIHAIDRSNDKRALTELLSLINDVLYISLFLGAGAEMVVLSLCTQFLSGIRTSWHHFEKGENIEGASHLLMGIIRGHQAIRQYQDICIREEIRTAQEEGKPYLPIANRAQLFFADLGYRINGLARWTVLQVGCCLNSTQTTAARIEAAAKVTFATPFLLASVCISTPCYFVASYVGTGRFQRIEAKTHSHFVPGDQIKGKNQNICGQDPYSIFTSGYPPPLAVGQDGTRRVDAIREEILSDLPDIYTGQEYDDPATALDIAEGFAQNGRTSIFDRGCNDPLFNHSGLFIAVPPECADSVGFIPIAPEHTSGITYGCNRGILTADIPFQNGQSLKVINLHLNAGSSPQDQQSRLVQLQRYIAPLMQGEQAAIAVGDANLDTSALSEAQKSGVRISHLVNALEGQVTCTDAMKHGGQLIEDCPDCQEKIDVILFDPTKVAVADVTLTPGNSDHSAISFTARIEG